MKSYYGDRTFLNSQAEFSAIIATSPTLLPSQPTTSNYDVAMVALRKYAEKCKLEMFLHACMLDYVGHDKIDPSLNVAEVYHRLSELKQMQFINEKLMTDTPDNQFERCR